jgi:hypothetical protein
VTLDSVFDANTVKYWYVSYYSEDRQKQITAGILVQMLPSWGK